MSSLTPGKIWTDISTISSSSSSSLKGSSSTASSSLSAALSVVYFSLDKAGIAEVGEFRPDPAGDVPVMGVIPAGVMALMEDRRRVSVMALMEGLREMEEFLRLDAADPERDRGGVSAKAKMDRSNSESQQEHRHG